MKSLGNIFEFLYKASFVILVPAGIAGIYIAVNRNQKTVGIALGIIIVSGLIVWIFHRKKNGDA